MPKGQFPKKCERNTDWLSERQFMICFLDYKKNEWVDFYQYRLVVLTRTFIQVFLHNRSPLIDLYLELFLMFKSDRDINDDF